MTQYTSKKKQKGFTLIELVVVIAILAILAAFALPRFAQLSEQAHQSSIRGTSGALSAGVALVKAQWVTNGSTDAVTDLEGFGNNDVDTSENGWPVPGGDGCAALWGKLLQANAPAVVVDGADTSSAEYQATAQAAGVCRYEYLLDEQESYIEYNSNTGEMATVIN
ncbi:MAG: prepilin-type N-terminal cleavage/methylation domain-containing protein [Pseudomonadota bacterium]